MAAQWTEEEAERVFRELAKRSMTDPEFRTLALSNPTAAVAKINPQPLPPNFTIRFVENKGVTKTLVLPDPVAADAELSDAELEQVAGGGDGNRCGGSCVGSCVFSSDL